MMSSYSLTKPQSFNGKRVQFVELENEVFYKRDESWYLKCCEGRSMFFYTWCRWCCSEQIWKRFDQRWNKICSVVWKQKLSSLPLLGLMNFCEFLIVRLIRNVGHPQSYPWKNYWGKESKVGHINSWVWIFQNEIWREH